MRQCSAVARPLALLERLQGEEAAIQAAYEILAIERKDGNDFKPAKKKAVLIWLADRRHDDAIEQAAPFLDDFDEGVRYAATEVIAAQKDESGAQPLLTILTNPEEDSNRLRVRVCEVMAQHRWPVGESEAALAQSLPDGFRLSDGRILRA